jgi:hypothetical protein
VCVQPTQIVKPEQEDVEDYYMAVKKNKNIVVRRQLATLSRWKAPPDGVYKIN